MHYVEIGGGLGDIINQCYLTGNYVALDGITQRTIILLACHHKFAREIFTQHPKYDLFDILEGRYFGYPVFPDGCDLEETRLRLPSEGHTPLPTPPVPRPEDVVFHPNQTTTDFSTSCLHASSRCSPSPGPAIATWRPAS